MAVARHLTEMERQIYKAAWRAYSENLRLIWTTPESYLAQHPATRRTGDHHE